MRELDTPLNVELTTYAGLINTTVSTEGLTDIIESVPAFFNNRLSEVVSFFNGKNSVIEEYDTKKLNVYAKELLKSKSVVSKEFKDVDYGKVSRRLIPVTTGLKVNILDMAKTLELSNQLVADNIMDVLNETAETVARLVADKELRLSSRPIMMDKKHAKVLKQLESGIASLLDPRKVEDTATVKTLAPSLPHVEEAIKIGLVYSRANTTDTYEEIRKAVKVITNYGNALHDTFKEEGVNIKKKRVIEVAEYLNMSANFVTQSINTMYLSNQSIIIMNNLVKTIVK